MDSKNIWMDDMLSSGIDCHVHINPFNEDQVEYAIKSTRRMIIFPDVFIPELFCMKGHIVRCTDFTNDGTVVFTCDTCGKLIYTGIDPYRKYNEKLLRIFESRKGIKWIFPLVTISPYAMEEFKYYDENYSGLYSGFKMHPNFSTYCLSKLELIGDYPILFHSGVGEFENPMLQLEFARKYKGTVIVAHMGRFLKECYDSIKKLNNVLLDCSALSLLWSSYVNRKETLFCTSYLGNIRDINDLIVASIDYVGSDRVVFGSDYPYGDYEENMKILLRSKLNELDLAAISINNIQAVLQEKAR